MRFLHTLIMTTVLLALAAASLAQQFTDQQLEELNDALLETGLDRDAIISIDRPHFISIENASLAIDREDIVFIWESPEGVRFYPRSIMLWHQIVNDYVGEGGNMLPYAITYSPLTGSVVGYSGQVDRFKTTFGDTGMLLNANMVMYDRSTNSLWPQILGSSIEGLLVNQQLDSFTLLWSVWEKAINVYPDAQVLSRDTGFRRAYNRDPYGSYIREGSYYTNQNVHHPLTHKDARLPPKERILGLKQGAARMAVARESVKEAGAMSFTLGVTPLVAVYDPRLDAVRIFNRTMDGKTLDLAMRAGELTDDQTGSVWSWAGRGKSGALTEKQLEPYHFMECMWFAWAAFHPRTELVQ